MRTNLLVATLCLTGCNFMVLGNNDPDSGVVCAASTGGSGSLTGLSVGSAYQSTTQYLTIDGGRVTGAAMNLRLHTAILPCGGSADGGGGDSFFMYVSEPGADRIVAKRYPVPSAADGGASFVGYLVTGGVAKVANAGALTLTAVTSCTAEGTLDVQLGEPDGGTVPFVGNFTSAYCQK